MTLPLAGTNEFSGKVWGDFAYSSADHRLDVVLFSGVRAVKWTSPTTFQVSSVYNYDDPVVGEINHGTITASGTVSAKGDTLVQLTYHEAETTGGSDAYTSSQTITTTDVELRGIPQTVGGDLGSFSYNGADATQKVTLNQTFTTTNSRYGTSAGRLTVNSVSSVELKFVYDRP